MTVVLRDQRETCVRLDDPAGGYFDAAGDFDRLVGSEIDQLTTWSKVDPDDEVTMTSQEMPGLLRDLEQLRLMARPGPEKRGVERLRVMAERCRVDEGLSLCFIGD